MATGTPVTAHSLTLCQSGLGPTPPDSLVDLMKLASNEIYAAVGVNPAMMTAGDAASLPGIVGGCFYSALVAPLGRKVAAELNSKLGDGISKWNGRNSERLIFKAVPVRWQGWSTLGATLESAAAETGFHNLIAAPIPEPDGQTTTARP